MEILSGIEQALYDYVAEKGEVTFDEIKKDLGDKSVGATGKLIRKDLVEIGKKSTGEQPVGYSRYGLKCVKTLKIKGVK